MELRIPDTGQKDARTAARTAKARKWARLLLALLIGLCLTAIWQEERLAPPLHAGLKSAADVAMGYISESEALSEALVELQKSYDQLTSDG